MKYFNGEHYVEVKDHQYKIHPTENIILRKRKQILSQQNIKFKILLRLEEIRKSLKKLMMK